MMKMRLIGIMALAGAMLAASAWAGEIEIKVPTLVCDMCSGAIVKAIQGVEGVKTVKPDMDKKVMRVTVEDKAGIQEKIEQAISKAGYQANNIKADPKAFANLPGCCQAKPGSGK
jgi:periplasmic mercuric ion binding protein